MATGTVSWYRVNDGYTIIAPDNGDENVAGYYSLVTHDTGLVEGQRVSYDIIDGPKFIVASDIEAIGPPPADASRDGIAGTQNCPNSHGM